MAHDEDVGEVRVGPPLLLLLVVGLAAEAAEKAAADGRHDDDSARSCPELNDREHYSPPH